jgi:hypothetical protein
LKLLPLEEYELIAIETHYQLRIPPDVRLYLRTVGTVDEFGFYDWKSEAQMILAVKPPEISRNILKFATDPPLENLVPYFQQRYLQFDGWNEVYEISWKFLIYRLFGPPKGSKEESEAIIRSVIYDAPKLIKIGGNKFIPEGNQNGNSNQYQLF